MFLPRAPSPLYLLVCLLCYPKSFPVTMERRPHPFPFRTRSLSSSSPMVLQSYVLWESRTLPGLHLYREVFSISEDLVFFAWPGTPTGAEMGRTFLEVKVLSAPDTLLCTCKGGCFVAAIWPSCVEELCASYHAPLRSLSLATCPKATGDRLSAQRLFTKKSRLAKREMCTQWVIRDREILKFEKIGGNTNPGLKNSQI